MFCKKCGTQLEADALFCPTCGTPVNEKPEDATVHQATEAQAQPTQVQAQPTPAQAQPVQPVQNQYMAPQPVQNQYMAPQPVISPDANNDKKKKFIIIGGIAAGVIILLIVIIAIASKGSGDNGVAPENTNDNGYSYSDNDDTSSSNDYYEEDNNTTTTNSSSGSGNYYSSAELKNKGDDIENGDGYVSATFDNPKVYSGSYIIIDGVKVDLPSTPQKIEELTGFAIELPDNQLEAMTLSYRYAKKGDMEITLNLTNHTDSPLAYKDCAVEYITVNSEYGDCPIAEAPIGIKIGDKANLAGVIEAFGTPSYYYLSTDPEYSSCSLRYDLDENGYNDVEITIHDDIVTEIKVSAH